jgi:hypothetical protein
MAFSDLPIAWSVIDAIGPDRPAGSRLVRKFDHCAWQPRQPRHIHDHDDRVVAGPVVARGFVYVDALDGKLCAISVT